MANIRSYKELRVYQAAMDTAMEIFHMSKSFPSEEQFSITDQIRRSSRSVCTNLAEAWRKRRYPKHFVSKITDSEMEAEETRVWLEFAFRCDYISKEQADTLDAQYDKILGQLGTIESKPHQWTIR